MPSLIDRIGQRHVETVANDATPREAAEQMHEAGVGCLVVTDESGRAVGMLTDRDLALRVVGRVCDPDATAVSEAMSTPLVTLDANAELRDVIRCMRTRGIRRVPLVESGQLQGIVSLDDVTQVLATEMRQLGQETGHMVRHARRHGKLDRVHREVDEKLHDAYERLQHVNWAARDSFLAQLGALRERLADAIRAMP